MENVSRIEVRDFAAADEEILDVTEHQTKLLDAEQASLESLMRCSQAAAASASFLMETGTSVVNPNAGLLLRRVKEAMNHAVDMPAELSECHKLAQRIADQSPKNVVYMTGGLPK